MSQPVKVMLVDDHLLLVEALTARLNQDPRIEVIGGLGSTDEAFKHALLTIPDVVVLDVDLPGRGSFDLISDLRSRLPNVKFILLTGYLTDVFVSEALRMGVDGYLLKQETASAVCEAIIEVANGSFCFSETVRRKLQYDHDSKKYTAIVESQLAGLTSRQIEVLRHLARGESVKEIARQMHLSQKSVDSHKYRIMHKLGIHDRVELARFAIREGLSLP